MRRFITALPLVMLGGFLLLNFAPMPRAQDTEQEESTLQGAMGTLKIGQRSLRSQIKDPAGNRDAILENLKNMQAAVLVAIAETPPDLEVPLEGDAKALWHVRYKQEMVGLLQEILNMEAAALRTDGDALNAGYKALSGVKKTGHQDFK
jgi:hypothetical protein